MAHWLFKSEPRTWSWDDHVKAGTEPWTGIRNYQAAENMKRMKCGDFGFFYHSVHGREIVGIVEVIKEHYPDPSDQTGRFCLIDLRAVKSLIKPVNLGQIKKDPRLQHLALVRQSRLSVMPIDDVAWDLLCHMGQTTAY